MQTTSTFALLMDAVARQKAGSPAAQRALALLEAHEDADMADALVCRFIRERRAVISYPNPVSLGSAEGRERVRVRIAHQQRAMRLADRRDADIMAQV
jgi:hypothetical protein